ncbi:MAG: capsular biosynthesis protein CpsI [Porticoccus sp.]|nr:capsular biosynthesis protein CpsI [Porticoccus sp.]
MNILITGSAGFIGSALTIELLNRGDSVLGVDNHNNYYDPALKDARLARHLNHPEYTHFKIDISKKDDVINLFENHQFDCVVNLAAQAGVRYSLENPMAYIDSNLVGFANIIESCRKNNLSHLIYASSSSVYGLNTKQPFSTHDSVNHPISLYAATKKANELMAHSYSHLYNLPTTGLRFFTVYGPFDRPDMALQKFTKAIINNETIKIFNYGKHQRDFTYIDDVVAGIVKIIDKPSMPNKYWNSKKPDPASSSAPYRLYNLGNNNPVQLISYIEELESCLGKVAKKDLLPIQAGDIPNTFADIDDFIRDFSFKPKFTIAEGVKSFVQWYVSYYK